MIEIKVTGINEVTLRLENVVPKIKAAARLKLLEAIAQVYEKAISQFPQKINPRQQSSYGVDDLTSSTSIAYIEIHDKIMGALEFGGKGGYIITPKNAPKLIFFWEKVGRRVALDSVWRQAIEGKHFIRDTLESELSRITEEISSIRGINL